jgi:hypothetical protein
VWEVQKNEFGDDCDTNSCDTFDNKKPFPACNTMGVVESTSDATSKKTTKCTGENGSTIENCKSFPCENCQIDSLKEVVQFRTNFSCGIPAAHHEENTREKSRLDATQNKPKCKNRAIVVNRCHCSTQNPPY